MPKLSQTFKFSIIAGSLVITTLLAWSVETKQWLWGKKPVVRHAVVRKEPAAKVYDTVLLNKYNQVASAFDPSKPFTYNGAMTVNNPADSTANLNAVPFLFSKNGKDCYYRIGPAEMLNAEGVSIFINHNDKTITLSQQKDIPTMGLPDFASLVKTLQFENYDLGYTTNKATATISFKNDRHITCKEYDFTYDTLTNKLISTRTLLTDFDDPLNKAKLKKVFIKVTAVTAAANIKKHLTKSEVVLQQGNQLILTKRFAGYQLSIF